jgi:hypothetical protein
VSLTRFDGVPGIFATGNWSFHSPNIGGMNGYRHYFADLNGDGRVDWIQIAINFYGGWASLSTAAQGVPGIFVTGVWDRSSSSIGQGSWFTHYFTDMNGDGKADLVQVQIQPIFATNALVSLGGTTGVPGILAGGGWDSSTNQIGTANNYTHYLVDLNGDGKADWIQVQNGYNYGYVSLSGSGAMPNIFSTGSWDFSSTSVCGLYCVMHYFADLNGDGKRDWIQLARNHNGGYVSFAEGSPGSCP